MKTKLKIFYVCFLTAALSVSVFAREYEAILLGQKANTSVSGGIANPSRTSALGENPAGLINNDQFSAQFAAVTGNNNFDPIGYGAGLFAGNGSVGGGLALQGFNSTDASPGNVLLLNWGLAAYLSDLDLAFGFTGTRTLFETGTVSGTGSGTTWCVDVGFIFNPRGDTRVGLSFFQLLNNVDAIGLGIAYDPSSSATLVLDGAFNPKNGSARIKPGLKFHLQNFELTSSYGFNILGTGSAWITNGFTLGVSVLIENRTVMIQSYLNHFAEYYLGVVISV